ncbi:hypothetical protein, partial [Pseudomonas syringae group genomosp. 7]|uniref:hypothetical protein n=1 Tax=Pseudomonas syringae group genomosp. 7 TaxID=251699 RepID=UPI00376F5C92
VELNVYLEPVTIKFYDSVLRGRLESGSFYIAVFYNKNRDFINEDAITPGNNQLTYQSNKIKHPTLTGAEHKGLLDLDSL